MEQSASMKAAVKAMNKVRSRYIGRKVLYIPAGTALEYEAEIMDMSYSFDTVAKDGTRGDWNVFIQYQTGFGVMTGNRACHELIPVGWTA